MRLKVSFTVITDAYGCWNVAKIEIYMIWKYILTLYLIKYIFIISPFSMISNIFSFSQNKFVFSKKHFYHIHIFFFQVKYICFITWIFHWILFCWAYLVFYLYLQNSEFYFQHVNKALAQGCEKAAKKTSEYYAMKVN